MTWSFSDPRRKSTANAIMLAHGRDCRTEDRSVRSRGTNRRRGHGRSLQGARPATWTRCSHQSAAAFIFFRSRPFAAFRAGSRAAAALNHPNILAIFDIGEDKGAPYVVSELLEGETLRDRLRSGALPTRKAIEFALQMAHGLAAAHEKASFIATSSPRIFSSRTTTG